MNSTRSLKRLFYHAERCMMCLECIIACETREYNRASPQLALSFEDSLGTPWIWMCRQCLTPPCVEACFSGGLERSEQTAVTKYDQQKCIRCGSCTLACPIEGTRISGEQGIPAKCDLCQGRRQPMCVEVCPSGALVYTDSVTFNRFRQKCYVKKLTYLR